MPEKRDVACGGVERFAEVAARFEPRNVVVHVARARKHDVARRNHVEERFQARQVH